MRKPLVSLWLTNPRVRIRARMGWASGYIARLQRRETVSFRPRGDSMWGKISSGDLCTVEPVLDAGNLEVGAIVLCTVKGRQFLHLVTAVRKGQLQIGNNQGHINGWISPRAIYGRCVRVEP